MVLHAQTTEPSSWQKKGSRKALLVVLVPQGRLKGRLRGPKAQLLLGHCLQQVAVLEKELHQPQGASLSETQSLEPSMCRFSYCRRVLLEAFSLPGISVMGLFSELVCMFGLQDDPGTDGDLAFQLSSQTSSSHSQLTVDLPVNILQVLFITHRHSPQQAIPALQNGRLMFRLEFVRFYLTLLWIVKHL